MDHNEQLTCLQIVVYCDFQWLEVMVLVCYWQLYDNYIKTNNTHLAMN